MSEARLRALYDGEIRPLLEAHAATVEQLGKHGLYPIGVFLVAVLGLVAFGIAQLLGPALLLVAVLVPTVAVLKIRGPVYQAGGAAFRALFKQQVVSRVVAQVLPGARYDPDLALARSVLEESGVVRATASYLGDDLVRGAIGRTPFALGDVRSRRSPGKTAQPPFQGLVFHADFNRSLAGRTLVIPQGESPLAVERNRGLAPTTLESPEFEAEFSVHASDAVEARYVLTPKMMERLLALRRLLGHRLYAAFDHGRVYVAVDQGRGAFEALAFGGEQAWKEILCFAALFDSARALVEELELNTRIWTKGFAPDAEGRAVAAFEPSAWSRVAALGAWAFQGARAAVPFRVDDPPAPPAQARVERRADGGLVARYRGSQGVGFVLGLLLAGFIAAGIVMSLREQAWPAAVLALAVAGTAVYCTRQQVRWMEAGPDGVRAGGLARRPRSLPRRQIVRVFAAEDLVMAQVEGSWIPALLSPRLGSHGAAVWLTGEIERVLAS